MQHNAALLEELIAVSTRHPTSEVRVHELRYFSSTMFPFHNKAPYCAHARRACRRTNAHAASTDELKDGSLPSRPAGLDGGERAQRHRAMCNRRHNFLHCYVESRDCRRLNA